MPRLTHFHFIFPSDRDRLLESLLPHLILCRSLHLDRININVLPLSPSLLPSLEQLSIHSKSGFKSSAITNELREFVKQRKKTLRDIHVSGGGKGESVLVEIEVALLLGFFEVEGFGTGRVEPPDW